MTYRLVRSNARRVEFGIQPPMRAAITLPVMVDGRDTGIAIYVSASAFCSRSTDDVAALVQAVADRVQLGE